MKVIHTSERGEVAVGEGSDGRRYVRKTGKFNTEVLRRITGINSPYVVKIIEFSKTEMITEYIDGQPLSEAQLPRDIAGLFRELCEGVSALHAAGVIHRDIKPSNIMLCGGHIKIIDFDAARIKKPAADKDTSFIGTDGFAPPEQYGFQQTDERSDIYSIGVTMKLLLRENYQSSPLRRIAEKCMRFDPNRRYASAKAASRAIALRKSVPAIVGTASALAACFVLVLLINFNGQPEAVPVINTTNPEIIANPPETTTTKAAATTTASITTTSAESGTTASKTAETTTTTSSATAENNSEAAEETTTSAVTYYKALPDEPSTTSKAPQNEFAFLPSDFPELPENISRTEELGQYIHRIYWDDMAHDEAEAFAEKINDWALRNDGLSESEKLSENSLYRQWGVLEGTVTLVHNKEGCKLTISI